MFVYISRLLFEIELGVGKNINSLQLNISFISMINLISNQQIKKEIYINISNVPTINVVKINTKKKTHHVGHVVLQQRKVGVIV